MVFTTSRTYSTNTSDFESTETKLFRAGLKHYRAHEERLIKNTRRSPNHDYHDTIDYERVQMYRFRAVSCTLGRPITNNSTSTTCMEASKNGSSIVTLSAPSTATDSESCGSLLSATSSVYLSLYSVGCYHMRKYDNAAHDFFYFSD